jgi:hypothetical protein
MIFRFPARSQASSDSSTPLPTEDHVAKAGWWPTKGTFPRSAYLGPEACAECHAEKSATQAITPMGHAAMLGAESEILRTHERLTFRTGPYSYEIVRAQNGSKYSVTNGERTISAPLSWAFGFNEVGQTYVIEKNGDFFESRLSYYKSTDALDFSPGHSHSIPMTLESAFGRPVYPGEMALCFGCHTTASTTGKRFDLGHLIPGITCEGCHGPGGDHVAAIDKGAIQTGVKLIFDPRKLNPIDSVDFCGACHRTSWDVALAGSTGIFNIRFQPYRLESSRCWGKGDTRITCVACHDPHRPLSQDLVSYDVRCLQCHATALNSKVTNDHPGAACPVGTQNCASCHMPKYEVPGMHSKFTDHRIRVVKNEKSFPD